MKIVLFVAQLLILHTIFTHAACPVEDDPTDLLRCIQIDISSLSMDSYKLMHFAHNIISLFLIISCIIKVALARGSNDLTSFCALASRYLECFKTYTRGCVGQWVSRI